jgi:hypothetical protein
MTIPQGSVRVKIAIDDSASQPPDAADVEARSSLDAVAERLTAAGLVVEDKLGMLAMIIGTVDESLIGELERVPGVAFVTPEREIGLI